MGKIRHPVHPVHPVKESSPVPQCSHFTQPPLRGLRALRGEKMLCVVPSWCNMHVPPLWGLGASRRRKTGDWHLVACPVFRRTSSAPKAVTRASSGQVIRERFLALARRVTPRAPLRYVRNHQERMNSPALRERRLPQGSGMVEGACKPLVLGRLRLAGCRWNARSASALLAVRSVLMSGLWGRFAASRYAFQVPSN
jgi:hypothetical protein